MEEQETLAAKKNVSDLIGVDKLLRAPPASGVLRPSACKWGLGVGSLTPHQPLGRLGETSEPSLSASMLVERDWYQW